MKVDVVINVTTETEELIDMGQKSMEKIYCPDYKVMHSTCVCDLHHCTKGNTLKCIDGEYRLFRRYIDEDRKRIFWSFI